MAGPQLLHHKLPGFSNLMNDAMNTTFWFIAEKLATYQLAS